MRRFLSWEETGYETHNGYTVNYSSFVGHNCNTPNTLENKPLVLFVWEISSSVGVCDSDSTTLRQLDSHAPT